MCSPTVAAQGCRRSGVAGAGAASPAAPTSALCSRRILALSATSGRGASAPPPSSASSGKPAGLSSSAPPAQHSFGRRPAPQPGGGASPSSACSVRSQVLYSQALRYAREEQFDVARRVFLKLTSECPGFVKPWVSWAQMEKRCMKRVVAGQALSWSNYENSRVVLQRGLERNRLAPPLLQAWGLLEMQRGNWVAAILLLDRSAALEPRNRPVLRWKPVVEARRTISARSLGVRHSCRRSTVASSAKGGGEAGGGSTTAC